MVQADADIIAGNDVINAVNASVAVTLYGDFGTDNRIDPESATFGKDRLYGSGGDDIIFGDSVSNLIGGNDKLYGGLGNDILRGGGGNDFFLGGGGLDTVVGGAGSDTLSVADLWGVRTGADYYNNVLRIDLARPANNSFVGTLDSYSGIENLSGRRFGTYDKDILYGDNAANQLSSRTICVLHGRGGDDVLRGGQFPALMAALVTIPSSEADNIIFSYLQRDWTREPMSIVSGTTLTAGMHSGWMTISCRN